MIYFFSFLEWEIVSRFQVDSTVRMADVLEKGQSIVITQIMQVIMQKR